MDMMINPEIKALIAANKNNSPRADPSAIVGDNSTATNSTGTRVLLTNETVAAANSTATTCPPTNSTDAAAAQLRLLKAFNLTENLQIEVLPSKESLPENMVMTWDIQEFKPKSMIIQLRFQKAAYISSGVVSILRNLTRLKGA